ESSSSASASLRHPRQLSPPLPHALAIAHASAARAAAPRTSESTARSEAIICRQRQRACGARSKRVIVGSASYARTSFHNCSSHADHGNARAAGHVRRPAERCALSYVVTSVRANRLLGVTTVDPAASAASRRDSNIQATVFADIDPRAAVNLPDTAHQSPLLFCPGSRGVLMGMNRGLIDASEPSPA